MSTPFPGMDPYLERADLWPDVHNSLVASIRDVLAPAVRPRYYVALEERAYVDEGPELVLVGRPDAAVVGRRETAGAGAVPATNGAAAVLEVEVPVAERIRETYLEVREVRGGEVVTVLEILSPSNKRAGDGRRDDLRKRTAMLAGLTSLVEIDLLRGGERMPIVGGWPPCDYGILISRSWRRPRAHLLSFTVRAPIPAFPVPLREGEDEPTVDLGELLPRLYDRASYDLRIDYRRDPEPSLREDDAAWAGELIRSHRGPEQ